MDLGENNVTELDSGSVTGLCVNVYRSGKS
jgi:hypothetical protein